MLIMNSIDNNDFFDERNLSNETYMCKKLISIGITKNEISKKMRIPLSIFNDIESGREPVCISYRSFKALLGLYCEKIVCNNNVGESNETRTSFCKKI